LVQDHDHCAQEKSDGRRILVCKSGAAIHGINRKGLLVGLPETIFGAVRSIPGDFVIDGEAVGDVLHAFDLVQRDGEDLRPHPYLRRLVSLARLLDGPVEKAIRLAETVTDPANKANLLRRLQAEKKEGIVFKRLDAPYAIH
jgi:bifunctional non-homologous end joining protein LigD